MTFNRDDFYDWQMEQKTRKKITGHQQQLVVSLASLLQECAHTSHDSGLASPRGDVVDIVSLALVVGGVKGFGRESPDTCIEVYSAFLPLLFKEHGSCVLVQAFYNSDVDPATLLALKNAGERVCLWHRAHSETSNSLLATYFNTTVQYFYGYFHEMERRQVLNQLGKDLITSLSARTRNLSPEQKLHKDESRPMILQSNPEANGAKIIPNPVNISTTGSNESSIVSLKTQNLVKQHQSLESLKQQKQQIDAEHGNKPAMLQNSGTDMGRPTPSEPRSQQTSNHNKTGKRHHEKQQEQLLTGPSQQQPSFPQEVQQQQQQTVIQRFGSLRLDLDHSRMNKQQKQQLQENDNGVSVICSVCSGQTQDVGNSKLNYGFLDDWMVLAHGLAAPRAAILRKELNATSPTIIDTNKVGKYQPTPGTQEIKSLTTLKRQGQSPAILTQPISTKDTQNASSGAQTGIIFTKVGDSNNCSENNRPSSSMATRKSSLSFGFMTNNTGDAHETAWWARRYNPAALGRIHSTKRRNARRHKGDDIHKIQPTTTLSAFGGNDSPNITRNEQISQSDLGESSNQLETGAKRINTDSYTGNSMLDELNLLSDTGSSSESTVDEQLIDVAGACGKTWKGQPKQKFRRHGKQKKRGTASKIHASGTKCTVDNNSGDVFSSSHGYFQEGEEEEEEEEEEEDDDDDDDVDDDDVDEMKDDHDTNVEEDDEDDDPNFAEGGSGRCEDEEDEFTTDNDNDTNGESSEFIA
eukprot:gene5444-8898_t